MNDSKNTEIEKDKPDKFSIFFGMRNQY